MAEPGIGVVIVTYRSADVIGPCLESLRASSRPVEVVVCDNASPDGTLDAIAGAGPAEEAPAVPFGRAAGRPAPAARTLIQTGGNLGYGAAVNLGLWHLARRPEIGLFWVLNPDCVVEPETAAAYAACAARPGVWGLMGGRTLFAGEGRVWSDGGRVRPLTGVCENLNRGCRPEEAPPPPPERIDFFTGANLVASRAFLESVGPMPEDYFLYYEEVAWAAARGPLALRPCPEARVHHVGGTAIGSGTLARRPTAFANYFNYRNRMRFVRRTRPATLPLAYAYALAQTGRIVLRDGPGPAWGAFAGLHGLPPPPGVRGRIAPEDRHRAFGRWGRAPR